MGVSIMFFFFFVSEACGEYIVVVLFVFEKEKAYREIEVF